MSSVIQEYFPNYAGQLIVNSCIKVWEEVDKSASQPVPCPDCYCQHRCSSVLCPTSGRSRREGSTVVVQRAILVELPGLDRLDRQQENVQLHHMRLFIWTAIVSVQVDAAMVQEECCWAAPALGTTTIYLNSYSDTILSHMHNLVTMTLHPISPITDSQHRNLP